MVNEMIVLGAGIGNNGMVLSYLLYVYDTMFMGEWDQNDVKNLIQISGSFYIVFFYGFSGTSFPFTYFGLSLGDNMARAIGWQLVMTGLRFVVYLKVKILSAEGNATLIKSVLGSLVEMMLFNEHNSLWLRLIKAFHGCDGGFWLGLHAQAGSGVWSFILGYLN
uniref:Uncharacterized protein n=1 Tax=Lactuca sativa TaxID=4236 RepID=A0A9R1V0I1_LACSA|nr:hypothetical protein LSAT_V11C700370630 [Lactuca sativa]